METTAAKNKMRVLFLIIIFLSFGKTYAQETIKAWDNVYKAEELGSEFDIVFINQLKRSSGQLENK